MTAQGAYKLIKARYMIDGRADTPMDHGAVLVEGSRIAAVGRAQDLAAPEGAPVEVFDYPTGTLMPGLIDVHCHFNYLGDGTHTDDVMAMSDDLLLMRSVMTPASTWKRGSPRPGRPGPSTTPPSPSGRGSSWEWPRAPGWCCAGTR